MADLDEALQVYRKTAPTAFVPPPVAQLKRVARSRTRRRRAAGVGGIAAVVVVGALLLANGLGVGPAPQVGTSHAPTTPAPSAIAPSAPSVASVPGPTAGSAGAAALEVTRVDWQSAELDLPAHPDGSCPQGQVKLRRGSVSVKGLRLSVEPVEPGKPLAPLTSGDLTGDGAAETVVYVHCSRDSMEDSGDGGGQLLVVTGSAGRLVGLGYVGPQGEDYPAARVADGRLMVSVRERYGNQVTQQRTYRYAGSRFVQVAGPTAFPV
jgi:hypothetical protein